MNIGISRFSQGFWQCFLTQTNIGGFPRSHAPRRVNDLHRIWKCVRHFSNGERRGVGDLARDDMRSFLFANWFRVKRVARIMSQLGGKRLALLSPCRVGALLNLSVNDFHLLVNLGARNIA